MYADVPERLLTGRILRLSVFLIPLLFASSLFGQDSLSLSSATVAQGGDRFFESHIEFANR